jgi:hypothetical protein
VLTGSQVASWTLAANTYLDTKSMTWDTLAGSWPDGNVALFAQATNTFGMTGSDSLSVLVDNVRPADPGAPAAVPTATADVVPVQWIWSMDGTLEVPRYALTIYRQGPSSSEDLGSWSITSATYETPSHAGTTIPYTLAASQFSRYIVGVKGCGPRWDAVLLPEWTSAEVRSAALYSRPLLVVAGTGDHEHTLAVSTPTFAATNVTYTWYRSEDAGAGWTAWEVITGEVGSSYHVHHLDEHPYRFRVKVDFTPTSGVATTIGSQVITQSGNHDYAFSGTPDWTPWW